MNVTFNGSVSAQSTDGETVTITVTKPDLTTETLTALTLTDKSYSTTKVYTISGSYKAKAHGNADAGFTAWDSAEVSFTIALATRTGTLIVTVA